MVRNYRGSHPSESLGWRKVGDVEDNDVVWSIYEKPSPSNEEWVTVKVVANRAVPNKANYWISVNKATNSVGFCRDFKLMINNRRSLFDKVSSQFMIGVKEEEIIASVDGK